MSGVRTIMTKNFGDQIDQRSRLRIEDLSIEQRRDWERSFVADPVRKHNELTYDGYWFIASQLKIDHAMGRLEGQS